jgi:hypothetical protein
VFGVVAVTVALNIFYFLALLASAYGPPARMIANVERSFATGDLSDQDYLVDDWRRGLNQYNDCMVIQLAINPRSSPLEKALAPVAYVSDDSYSDVCSSLRRILDPSTDKSRLYSDRYARYWHGYVPVTVSLLTLADISVARVALRAFVFAALLTLFVVALGAAGSLRRFGVSVAIAGALFWGLVYYGQALSYAPGDGMVMLGLAALILGSRTLAGNRLIIFSTAYGSLIVFFEMLTAQLPTAACLLFVASYLLPDRTVRGMKQVTDKWARAGGALLAFAAGALLTVLFKQALAAALVGPDVLKSFLSNLRYYAGMSPDSVTGLELHLTPFARLLFATHILTYRSILAGVALLACSGMAWLLAGYLALRSKERRQLSDFLAHLVGASGIVVWVLLLPTHTSEHASFMVRMLIVPVSLGWSVLWAALRPLPAIQSPGS